ncbi:hypothetical protein [Streptomyces sp. B6B3]|uniref:hypothetical protein n=1 Tax=Streptomyces sp. B6B3 TaxID=3153570 RepID=UPI00325E1035
MEDIKGDLQACEIFAIDNGADFYVAGAMRLGIKAHADTTKAAVTPTIVQALTCANAVT